MQESARLRELTNKLMGASENFSKELDTELGLILDSFVSSSPTALNQLGVLQQKLAIAPEGTHDANLKTALQPLLDDQSLQSALIKLLQDNERNRLAAEITEKLKVFSQHLVDAAEGPQKQTREVQ